MKLFMLLLLLVASASASSTICQNRFKPHHLNGLQFIHLESYCTVEGMIEFANMRNPLIDDLYWDCDHLDEIENLSATYAILCISQSTRQPNDELPLSSDTIRQRIASSATEIINYLSSEDCSTQDFTNIDSEEVERRLITIDQCLYRQIITDLTKAEEITDNFLSQHGIQIDDSDEK